MSTSSSYKPKPVTADDLMLIAMEQFHRDFKGYGEYKPINIMFWVSHINKFFREVDVVPPTVKEIGWYKNRMGLQHEFLVIVAEYIYENTSKDLYFRLERQCHPSRMPKGVQAADIVPPDVTETKDWDEAVMKEVERRLQADWDTQRKMELPPILAPFFSSLEEPQSSGDLTSPLPFVTNDTITRLSDDKAEHKHNTSPNQFVHLGTLVFGASPSPSYTPSGSREQQPPFRDVCLAACIVADTRPQYDVILYSSYWYPQMLVRLLEAQYRPRIVEHREYHDWVGRFMTKKKNLPVVVPRGEETLQELQRLKSRLDQIIAVEDYRYANCARVQNTKLQAHIAESEARRAELEAQYAETRAVACALSIVKAKVRSLNRAAQKADPEHQAEHQDRNSSL